MLRMFLLTLALLGVAVVAVIPILGSLVLIHRHTTGRTVFGIWLLGSLVYVAAVTAVAVPLLYRSGLIAWVEA